MGERGAPLIDAPRGRGAAERFLGRGGAPAFGALRERARFTRECERLRPLGEAYVMRRFAGQLSRADAEDAVAEVLIRLHRQGSEGRVPENLRAAFFTSVRNAAIDILRSRAGRPTVALEAAISVPAYVAAPDERAEGRDDGARLREALLRMRPKYREALLMRFGLSLSVPEIATHLQISLPAAKKLVLRATRQARERMEAIEGAQLCGEMRRSAEHSLVEKQAAGLLDGDEEKALRAHFAHCGPCRAHLHALRRHLNDLGSVAMLGLLAERHHASAASLLPRLAEWLGGMSQRLGEGATRVRHLALRTSAARSPGEGPAGVFLGSAQKIAAICGAGATATATCVLTGAVGPGLGATAPHHADHSRPAKVRSQRAEALPTSSSAPSPSLPVAKPAPTPEAPKGQHPVSPVPESVPPPEFGIEGGSAPPAPSSSPPPAESTSSGGREAAPSGAHPPASVGFQG